MNKHTPILLPVKPVLDHKVEFDYAYYRVVDADNRIVIALETKERADYIAKCINNHDKLVEALNLAYEVLEDGHWAETKKFIADALKQVEES
jgi:hypothetical protein